MPADSVEPHAAATCKLLLAALEDLSQDQLKRFRHKLRDAPVDSRSIPWGRLELADALDLADQLTQFYRPETALDVARRTLKKADVRDVAARLKAQRLQREWGWRFLGPALYRLARCHLSTRPPSFPVTRKTPALYLHICNPDALKGASSPRHPHPTPPLRAAGPQRGFSCRARPQLRSAALSVG